MTAMDDRACHEQIAALDYWEGEHLSDSRLTELKDNLRKCVNGNRDGLDPTLWLDAVEGYGCAIERARINITQEIDREKAKAALVGSSAPPYMYELGEQAMQVSEQNSRVIALLTRFEQDEQQGALVARSRQIRKERDCTGSALILSDCVQFEWARGRLTPNADGACAASRPQYKALRQLLGK